jgi:hypothetical protein
MPTEEEFRTVKCLKAIGPTPPSSHVRSKRYNYPRDKFIKHQAMETCGEMEIELHHS